MKLRVEISDEDCIKSFLSILSIGAFECIKDKKISIHQSEHLIFSPRMIHMFENHFPELSGIIHEATELSNISRIIPDKFDSILEELKQRSLEQIGFHLFWEHIDYDLDGIK